MSHACHVVRKAWAPSRAIIVRSDIDKSVSSKVIAESRAAGFSLRELSHFLDPATGRDFARAKVRDSRDNRESAQAEACGSGEAKRRSLRVPSTEESAGFYYVLVPST